MFVKIDMLANFDKFDVYMFVLETFEMFASFDKFMNIYLFVNIEMVANFDKL